jgi:hypothetical protein
MAKKFQEWLQDKDPELYEEYDWSALGTAAGRGGAIGAAGGALGALIDPRNKGLWQKLKAIPGSMVKGGLTGAAFGGVAKGIGDLYDKSTANQQQQQMQNGQTIPQGRANVPNQMTGMV